MPDNIYYLSFLSPCDIFFFLPVMNYEPMTVIKIMDDYNH